MVRDRETEETRREPPILNLGAVKPVAVLSIRSDRRTGPSTILNGFAPVKKTKTRQRGSARPEAPTEAPTPADSAPTKPQEASTSTHFLRAPDDPIPP